MSIELGYAWESNGSTEMLLSCLRRVGQGVVALLSAEGSVVALAKALIAEHVEPLYINGFDGEVIDYDILPAPVKEQFLALAVQVGALNLALAGDVRTTILLAAADFEAMLNQFLYFHLGETGTSKVDRASVADKLDVAHTHLQLAPFKNSDMHRALQPLFDWRHAFMHGKLPRYSTKLPLGAIFVRRIEELPVLDSQRELNIMLSLLDGYVLAQQHLADIATTPPICPPFISVQGVAAWVAQIRAIPQVEFADWSLSESERRYYRSKEESSAN